MPRRQSFSEPPPLETKQMSPEEIQRGIAKLRPRPGSLAPKTGHAEAVEGYQDGGWRGNPGGCAATGQQGIEAHHRDTGRWRCPSGSRVPGDDWVTKIWRTLEF